MPIKPHIDNNTWIIDCLMRENGKLKVVQMEFIGTIKEAMLKEKQLLERLYEDSSA